MDVASLMVTNRPPATPAVFAAAEAHGLSLAADIATLRGLSADEVLARAPNTSETLGLSLYVPLVDGYVVPDDPALLVGTNNQSKLPLLIGHNADEGLFYVRDLPKTLEDYRAFVRARFPAEFVDAVLARYPAATDATVALVAPLLETESRFVATAALTARAASKVSDVYMYRFSRVAPFSRSAWGGAAHTSEVPYVFDNTSGDASQFEEIDRTARLRGCAATARHPSRGSPSRSSRFGGSSRERRMVAQICPRWNRADWLREAEGYSQAA